MNDQRHDFENFMTDDGIDPPEYLSRQVLSRVHRDLNPSHQLVFFKLLIIQGFVGFLTLLFCPQFDLSLTNNYQLFHFFHRTFGHDICMALCGGVFLGSGALLASFFLSPEEIRKVRISRALYYFSLASIFLAGFMLWGVEVYLKIAAFWLMGAVGFGIFGFELASQFKLRVMASSP